MGKSNFKVGFCISGKGRLFLAALKQSSTLGIMPAFVFLDETASSELDSICQEHNIPCVRCDSSGRAAFDQLLTQKVLDAQLDLLVLTFNKLVPEKIVTGMPRKVLNVHMSLLPAFPGFGALQKAIETGVRIAGATIHEVTTGIDDGPIVAQCEVAVDPHDNVETLGWKIYQELEPLYLQVLASFASGPTAVK